MGSCSVEEEFLQHPSNLLASVRPKKFWTNKQNSLCVIMILGHHLVEAWWWGVKNVLHAISRIQSSKWSTSISWCSHMGWKEAISTHTSQRITRVILCLPGYVMFVRIMAFPILQVWGISLCNKYKLNVDSKILEASWILSHFYSVISRRSSHTRYLKLDYHVLLFYIIFIFGSNSNLPEFCEHEHHVIKW